MATHATAAPPSPSESLRSRRTSSLSARSPPLSLDFSDLPPLITPSPPSNTLLITNLQEPSIFHPANLLTIRDLVNQHATIHSWAPLKSFRRIVVTFYDIESAITIRQKLDNEVLMGDRVRIYFGSNTPLNPTDQHLQAPKAAKLFFISPPPSPPHGWEMRNEEPPNKEVHAEDLATALSKLHAKNELASPVEEDERPETAGSKQEGLTTRNRSSSTTIVYHPQDHGHSPDLPAIAVEDTTYSPVDLSNLTPTEDTASTKMLHTARPPVELMDTN